MGSKNSIKNIRRVLLLKEVAIQGEEQKFISISLQFLEFLTEEMQREENKDVLITATNRKYVSRLSQKRHVKVQNGFIDKTLENFISKISENEKSKKSVPLLLQMIKSKLYDSEMFMKEIDNLIYDLNNEKFSIEDLKDFLENNNPSINQSIMISHFEQESINSIDEHSPSDKKIDISTLLTKDYNNQISSIHQSKKEILLNSSTLLTKKSDLTPKNRTHSFYISAELSSKESNNRSLTHASTKELHYRAYTYFGMQIERLEKKILEYSEDLSEDSEEYFESLLMGQIIISVFWLDSQIRESENDKFVNNVRIERSNQTRSKRRMFTVSHARAQSRTKIKSAHILPSNAYLNTVRKFNLKISHNQRM